MKKTTFSIYLYPRAKAGLYDLTIRKTFNRRHMYIKLGIELSKKQWKKNLIVNHPDADTLNTSVLNLLPQTKNDDQHNLQPIKNLRNLTTLNSFFANRFVEKLWSLQSKAC